MIWELETHPEIIFIIPTITVERARHWKRTSFVWGHWSISVKVKR